MKKRVAPLIFITLLILAVSVSTFSFSSFIDNLFGNKEEVSILEPVLTGRAITNLNCNALEQTYYFGGVAIAVNNLGAGESGKQACLNWCNSKTEGKSCWWFARDGGCLVGSGERIPYPNLGDPNVQYSYASNCVTGTTQQPAPNVTITSIIPTSGLPGSNVTITGTNFIGVNSVLFDLYNINDLLLPTPASFGIKSSTELSVVVPSSLISGIYNIDVITLNNGRATKYNAFNVTNVTTLPVPINGVCGSSNGQTFTTTPVTNLCSQGTPSNVANNVNTYTWTCQGSNGGSTASCSATKSSSIPTLKCNSFIQYRWWDYNNYNNQLLGSYSAGVWETGKQKCLNWCSSLRKAGICTWYSNSGACSLHTGNMINKSSAYMFASACVV